MSQANAFSTYQLRLSRWIQREILLRNKDFTILSSNCIGARIYIDFHLEYRTPTIGLFFWGNDFVTFLEKLDYYLDLPLQFTSVSKFGDVNELRKKEKFTYPIGKLDDIEINFMHYKDPKEATEKWERRKKRINKDNLFIIGTDRDGFTTDTLERFEKLPYKNKVLFAAKPYEEPFVVFMKEYFTQDHIGDVYGDDSARRYLNIVKWINTGKIN